MIDVDVTSTPPTKHVSEQRTVSDHQKQSKHVQTKVTKHVQTPRRGTKKKYWINRRDLLVSGYIRAHQRHLEGTATLHLPVDIIQLVVNWCLLNDTWQQYGEFIADHMRISHNRQCIERVSNNAAHCYYCFGGEVIDKKYCTEYGVKRWRLRIDHSEYYTKNYCSMLIGIVETAKINWIKSLLGDFTYGVYKGYALRVATKSRFVHQNHKRSIYLQSGQLRKGDVLSIELDLRGQTHGRLKYKFEDQCGAKIAYGIDAEYRWLGSPKYVAFDRIDVHKKYTLVVGMYCRNKVSFLEPCK